MIKAYRDNNEALSEHLKDESFRISKFTSIKAKLSTVVANSETIMEDRTPQGYISNILIEYQQSPNMKNPPPKQEIRFACPYDKLTMMTNELKDALEFIDNQ